ncbi:alpha/beta hydrolase [Marinomonas algarum]|uniref:Alpha/beta hydrolase n=1 Tax=Marinomonas algarum TaxID=2883105 RepID=A0A9X1LDX8_9GAMM|nr:alpha/beta fold hydrolase [Marinomonas algarum]MCB5160406.1 alpha/beta hydrolase [Marinomonas algarum]
MTYIIAFLVILIVALSVFALMIHFGFRAPREVNKETPQSQLAIDYVQLTIPAENNKQLSAWLLPVKDAQSTVVILHGWGSNSEMMLPLAKPFYDAGMNVLLFDARSHGDSEGDTFSSLPRFSEDLHSALDWYKQQYSERSKKLAVLGHSVGAGAVLLAASQRQDVDAVISISAFAHPKWMMQRYLSSVHIPPSFQAPVIRYVEWVIGQPFDSFAPIKTACQIQSPVLIVHGNADRVIPVDDARVIMNHCTKGHLQLIEVDGAGHDSVDKIELHSQQLIDFLRLSRVI